MRLPFRYLEPAFFAGLLDDPVLLLRVRPLGRNLLIDCGQVHHLAKRVMKAMAAIFISHAHMDHFMGVDTFIRHVHVSPRTFDFYGPPGLARKLASKLAAYDWNLTEETWCTFRVQEVHEGRLETWILPGPDGFPCRFEGERPIRDGIIYRNDYLTVAAELCDHKIPVLIFRITERPPFRIDEAKLDRSKLVRGEWLRELKRRFCTGSIRGEPISVLQRSGNGVEERSMTDADLLAAIRKEVPPASIGYVTDVGFTDGNREKIRRLLQGVTLLLCECTFLRADRDKARISYHLCTEDLNTLAAELRPAYLLPMHLSKAYVGRTSLLYRELNPPAAISLLRLPEHLTPRPLLPRETGWSAGDEKEDDQDPLL